MISTDQIVAVFTVILLIRVPLVYTGQKFVVNLRISFDHMRYGSFFAAGREIVINSSVR